MSVKETLQNQYGSDLVHDLAMAGERASGGMEMAVGFGGGEALVPQVDGEGKSGAQAFREGLGSFGLRAEVAGHVKRVADDDGRAAELAEKAAEGFQVLLRVFADEGEHGLGSEAQLVRDGDADASAAKIEAKEAFVHRVKGTG